MPRARPRFSGEAAAHSNELALGPYAPSPTPTSARKNNSIGKDVDSSDPMVAIAHTRTPVKITRRGPKRSAIGPDTSDAIANTSKFTAASNPSWNLDRPND